MKLFDIDGTLTYAFGDISPDRTGLPTYAFWPLLSYHFAADASTLRAAAEAWDQSDKGTGDAFIKSSHDMLQQGINLFRPGVNGAQLRIQAKAITFTLLDHGAVRMDAIAFLRQCLESGDLCILSTGSYEDGAWGFVDALLERNLLPATETQSRLWVSGAQIDWATGTVLHANIAGNKVKGLQALLAQKEHPFDPRAITGIYVDDPTGNDDKLCELNSEKVFVIRTHKNQTNPELKLTEWEEIMRNSTPFQAASPAAPPLGRSCPGCTML